MSWCTTVRAADSRSLLIVTILLHDMNETVCILCALLLVTPLKLWYDIYVSPEFVVSGVPKVTLRVLVQGLKGFKLDVYFVAFTGTPMQLPCSVI